MKIIKKKKQMLIEYLDTLFPAVYNILEKSLADLREGAM